MPVRADESVKIATFNVLKPLPWMDWLLQSTIRYNYQIGILFPNLEADVICLNEVTEPYVELLENDSFLKSTYQHPPFRPKDALPDDLRVVILSRIPYKLIWQRRQEVCILLLEKNLIVIATHLSAYEERMAKRISELNRIENKLKEYCSSEELNSPLNSAVRKGNVLLLGDLNLHLVGETESLWGFGYEDLWLKKYTHEDGYTWDPNINSMIRKWLWLDNRRMRLDRICMKQSEEFDLQDIKIFGNTKIPGHSLFPSDHFGLQAEVAFVQGGGKSSGMQGANSLRGDFLLPSASARKLKHTDYYGAPMPIEEKMITGFRTLKQIIAYRVALLLLSLGILSIGGWKFFQTNL